MLADVDASTSNNTDVNLISAEVKLAMIVDDASRIVVVAD
jgi:hypothetical protein